MIFQLFYDSQTFFQMTMMETILAHTDCSTHDHPTTPSENFTILFIPFHLILFIIS